MDIADGFSLVGNGCCRFNGDSSALTPPGTLMTRVEDEQACLQVSCRYSYTNELTMALVLD